jgi:protocatechuate 3,4-dioxygenase beta subunit
MHAHNLGLAHDLHTLLQRRRALRWLGALGALAAAGCGGGGDDASASTTTDAANATATTGNTAATSSCSLVPEETAGPYPGDGSNAANGQVANALALSGIVRSDIRSSIAGSTGVAAGVPLKVVIRLVNTNGGCAELSGYALYLWHCDAQGRYSMYSTGVTAENYLRGVQITDADGEVAFQTIYPGCYSGRMPHIHFEVYRSATTATSFSNKLRTSQMAFANEVSTAVYADSRYSGSAANLSRISFTTDNVFSDGVTLQLASVTGSASEGYVATLTVGISV